MNIHGNYLALIPVGIESAAKERAMTRNSKANGS